MFTGIKLNDIARLLGIVSLGSAAYYFGKKGASIPKALIYSSLIGIGGVIVGQKIGGGVAKSQLSKNDANPPIQGQSQPV